MRYSSSVKLRLTRSGAFSCSLILLLYYINHTIIYIYNIQCIQEETISCRRIYLQSIHITKPNGCVNYENYIILLSI